MKTKAITFRRAVLLTMMTLMLVGLVTTPAVFAQGEPVDVELTWGNDEEWEMLAPLKSRGGNSNRKAHRPLYLIAPIDPANPQSPRHPPLPAPLMIGAHDHVIPVPPKNKGTFTAIWHVLGVHPSPAAVDGVNVTIVWIDSFVGPVPFLSHADLGFGLEPLTSADKIELAADLGLADILDVPPPIGPLDFVCPVRPIK